MSCLEARAQEKRAETGKYVRKQSAQDNESNTPTRRRVTDLDRNSELKVVKTQNDERELFPMSCACCWLVCSSMIAGIISLGIHQAYSAVAPMRALACECYYHVVSALENDNVYYMTAAW